LSVLHRIDHLEQMPGPRFFAYCYRLPAYQGVLATVVQRQRAKQAQAASAAPMSLTEWARAHPAEMEAAARHGFDEGR